MLKRLQTALIAILLATPLGAGTLTLRSMLAADDRISAAQNDANFAELYSAVGHGFAVGDLVYKSGASSWAKAIATAEATFADGVVVHVEDANTAYIAVHFGQPYTDTAHGLGAAGTAVYLSDSVAGAVTTSTTDQLIGQVLDANTIIFGVMGGGGGSGEWDGTYTGTTPAEVNQENTGAQGGFLVKQDGDTRCQFEFGAAGEVYLTCLDTDGTTALGNLGFDPANDAVWFGADRAGDTAEIYTVDGAVFRLDGTDARVVTGTALLLEDAAGGGDQCLRVDTNGRVEPTGSDCGAGGGGDITDVWTDTTGGVDALVAASGDSLDATSADTAVPWRVNNTAAPTVEGQAIWDADDNRLAVGNGATTSTIYPGLHAASVSDGGPATTATALAADPTDCSAGSYTVGINASGTAQGCTADDDTPDSDGEVPNDITVASSADLATAGKVQLGHLTAGSASCIAIDTDRPYADKDCDGVKDAGEEYLDGTGGTTGVLNVNTTTVGNITTGEDDLITYLLPGGTLAADGDGIEIEASGTIGAVSEVKTVKCYFGATQIITFANVTGTAFDWRVTATVLRTGAATQRSSAAIVYLPSATTAGLSDYTTPGETLSGDVTIKCTGTATTTDEIQQTALVVTRVGGGSGSGGSGDSITVNASAAADANFINGDIDWTLDTGPTPDTIAATVACSGCIDATDIATGAVDLASGDVTGILPIANGGAGWTHVPKQTTETIQSDISVNADTDLKFTVAASTKYRFRLEVFYATTDAADFRFTITGPSSPTLYLDRRDCLAAGSVVCTPASSTALATETTLSTSVTTPGWIAMSGFIHNGSNSGTVAFAWAQMSSSATNTSVLAGSYLEWEIAQ